ncbi:hypothetical protein [Stenotrophomonas sp. NLF4-10]|uniref:hypothetical protein n=1 Tax=Stenotrophomonas sp. NLF4-10 TaxID=2918754 RepID=UPI001EFBF930|nr:hypothetical protein [Stenotrophomonas sp. NLF4-10]MCG8275368.1 hypothetical protein [Stenotrophomonas sp. NLF4-10]
MSQVIIFPRGQLTELDRARMDEAGIVAVEADNPEQVVVTVPGAPLAGANDLMLSALHAVVECGFSSAATEFSKELRKRLTMREKKANSHGAGDCRGASAGGHAGPRRVQEGGAPCLT